MMRSVCECRIWYSEKGFLYTSQRRGKKKQENTAVHRRGWRLWVPDRLAHSFLVLRTRRYPTAVATCRSRYIETLCPSVHVI